VSRTIIFVDDEQDLCDLYGELYASADLEVHCFTDLTQAEDFVHKNQVALAFIDYRMPTMNGIDFRHRLPQQLPCVLLSGEYFEHEPLGFKKILEKPLKRIVFEQILQQYANDQVTPAVLVNPYKCIFNHLPQEVHVWQVIKDSNLQIKTWKLIDANESALASWGKKIEDVVGKRAEEIFPEANPTQQFLPIVQKVMKTKEPYTWTEFFRGTGQRLEMTTIPYGDKFISISMVLD
jgi:CheY-like chemotaxis protein